MRKHVKGLNIHSYFQFDGGDVFCDIYFFINFRYRGRSVYNYICFWPYETYVERVCVLKLLRRYVFDNRNKQIGINLDDSTLFDVKQYSDFSKNKKPM